MLGFREAFNALYYYHSRCREGGGIHLLSSGTLHCEVFPQIFIWSERIRAHHFTKDFARKVPHAGYLQPDELKKHNLHHFDSWAATFGEPVTAMELSPDGAGYRLNTRFARFINVPELMRQFRQVTDLKTQAMLKLPIPFLRNGKPTIVSAPCSSELKEIVGALVKRADALRTG